MYVIPAIITGPKGPVRRVAEKGEKRVVPRWQTPMHRFGALPFSTLSNCPTPGASVTCIKVCRNRCHTPIHTRANIRRVERVMARE